jgi:hypothetical protein
VLPVVDELDAAAQWRGNLLVQRLERFAREGAQARVERMNRLGERDSRRLTFEHLVEQLCDLVRALGGDLHEPAGVEAWIARPPRGSWGP